MTDPILVFPFDGGQHRPGTFLGPDELLRRLAVDERPEIHRISVIDETNEYKERSRSGSHKNRKHHEDDSILRTEPIGVDFMWNADSVRQNSTRIYQRCFGLFGDHSMEGGFFLGNSVRNQRNGFEKQHLFFLDAHGDSHHPKTSPSGNFHGMMLGSLCLGVDVIYGSNPLVVDGVKIPEQILCGEKQFAYRGDVWFPDARPLNPRNLTLFGSTDIDEPLETAILEQYKKMGATVWSPEDIAHVGVKQVLKSEVDKVPPDAAVHISLDVDVTRTMSCTGTPAGEVPFDDVMTFLRGVASTGQVRSFGMYEMNPLLNPSNLENDATMWRDYFQAVSNPS